MTPGAHLRALIAADGAPLVAPGVFDFVSARLASKVGFDCVHASGGSIVRSMGLPDLGLASFDKITVRMTEIVEGAGVPVIADADDGYGNEANVALTVRSLERAGVAALHIEDQAFPKRCGFYDGVELIPSDRMVAKVKAALDARLDSSLVVIARTDSYAIEGLDGAMERARLYAEAGADMIFTEGIRTATELETVGRGLKLPKMLNAGNARRAPVLDLASLKALGYAVVIFPADVQCAALYGIKECLEILKRDGETAAMEERLIPLEERDDLVDLGAWLRVGT